jgi:hypothetical protein
VVLLLEYWLFIGEDFGYGSNGKQQTRFLTNAGGGKKRVGEGIDREVILRSLIGRLQKGMSPV